MSKGVAAGQAFRACVLLLSFVESFATILLERGMYFFSHERLAYSLAENLGLAAAFGAAYAIGARSSHTLSRKLGERTTLLATLGLLFVLHSALYAVHHGPFLALGFALIGWAEGAKWPVVESYVGAGLGHEAQLRAVGHFNVSWALAVPLALALTGPVIARDRPQLLFALAAAANALSLGLVLALPPAAPHLSASHPLRPPAALLDRYRVLLACSRWSMLSSYALLFLLAPLLPGVLEQLGADVVQATSWAAGLDVVRLGTFAFMTLVPVWQGRLAPLLLGALGLPLSFVAIVWGPSLAFVLAGEVAFGILAGLTYHSALYYALVLENASVDAGGAHEGLIGLGLVLGPLLGWVGQLAARDGASYVSGIVLGASPLVLACWFGICRALSRWRGAPR